MRRWLATIRANDSNGSDSTERILEKPVRPSRQRFVNAGRVGQPLSCFRPHSTLPSIWDWSDDRRAAANPPTLLRPHPAELNGQIVGRRIRIPVGRVAALIEGPSLRPGSCRYSLNILIGDVHGILDALLLDIRNEKREYRWEGAASAGQKPRDRLPFSSSAVAGRHPKWEWTRRLNCVVGGTTDQFDLKPNFIINTRVASMAAPRTKTTKHGSNLNI